MNRIYNQNEALARTLYNSLKTTSPKGPIIIPSAGPYRSVFAWDSGWNYFWLKELSPETAREELTTLFNYQEEDGRISHEVMLEPRSAYRGIRRFQLWLLRDCFAPNGYAHLIDPPAFIWAALDCIQSSLVPEHLESNSFLLKASIRMLNWLDENRTLKELAPPFNALPVLLHPLESGTDHAPSFDTAYGGPLRLYLNTFLLASRLGKYDWKLSGVRNKVPLFYDLTFISLYLISLEKIGELKNSPSTAHSLDAEAVEALENFSPPADLGTQFISKFYDPDKKCFKSFFYTKDDIRENENLTFSSMLPFLLKNSSAAEAKTAIETHALPGGTFYHSRLPDFNTKEADTAPLHKKLWRGSCSWMNMNYLHFLLLTRYGFTDEALRMTEDLSDCVARGEAREYFHAETLKGGGCDGFSWNGLLLSMSAFTRNANGILSA